MYLIFLFLKKIILRDERIKITIFINSIKKYYTTSYDFIIIIRENYILILLILSVPKSCKGIVCNHMDINLFIFNF